MGADLGVAPGGSDAGGARRARAAGRRGRDARRGRGREDRAMAAPGASTGRGSHARGEGAERGRRGGRGRRWGAHEVHADRPELRPDVSSCGTSLNGPHPAARARARADRGTRARGGRAAPRTATGGTTCDAGVAATCARERRRGVRAEACVSEDQGRTIAALAAEREDGNPPAPGRVERGGGDGEGRSPELEVRNHRARGGGPASAGKVREASRKNEDGSRGHPAANVATRPRRDNPSRRASAAANGAFRPRTGRVTHYSGFIVANGGAAFAAARQRLPRPPATSRGNEQIAPLLRLTAWTGRSRASWEQCSCRRSSRSSARHRSAGILDAKRPVW